MLTANVAAVVTGTTLTLTTDSNGNHDVNVYRTTANKVEIDGGGRVAP